MNSRNWAKSLGSTLSRRDFLSGVAAATLAPLMAQSQPQQVPALAGVVGITSGSLAHQMNIDSPTRMLKLWDLPRLMRDELGMSVLESLISRR